MRKLWAKIKAIWNIAEALRRESEARVELEKRSVQDFADRDARQRLLVEALNSNFARISEEFNSLESAIKEETKLSRERSEEAFRQLKILFQVANTPHTRLDEIAPTPPFNSALSAVATYQNCAPNICTTCKESVTYYSQFANGEIICRECLNGRS